MANERRLRILLRLAEGPDRAHELSTERLCRLCAEVCGVSGAGVMLLSHELGRGAFCTTDEVSARIEELQFSLGEGPCVDAYEQDRPIAEPDLGEPASFRWSAFAPAALQAGVRAVFAFPLRVGAIRLGSLGLYNTHAGRLRDEQHGDALVVADLVAESVLLMQAEAAPGMLAAQLEAGADFYSVIHQAAGMVSAQLGVGVAHAMVRLRAHAYGNERMLADVARDVVARTLRFESSHDDQDGP